LSRENDDELPPGVNKIVKVRVAQIRKISVGISWQEGMVIRV